MHQAISLFFKTQKYIFFIGKPPKKMRGNTKKKLIKREKLGRVNREW